MSYDSLYLDQDMLHEYVQLSGMRELNWEDQPIREIIHASIYTQTHRHKVNNYHIYLDT